jgi:hypothetical protein
MGYESFKIREIGRQFRTKPSRGKGRRTALRPLRQMADSASAPPEDPGLWKADEWSRILPRPQARFKVAHEHAVRAACWPVKKGVISRLRLPSQTARAAWIPDEEFALVHSGWVVLKAEDGAKRRRGSMLQLCTYHYVMSPWIAL